MNNSSVPTLHCAGVEKTYQEGGVLTEALRGVSCDIYAGESVAIVGASGSGKSTLLHILGGLTQATRGVVEWSGQALASLSETTLCQLRNRQVGFVYQFHHLLPEFTACDNVAMPLLLRGESYRHSVAAATTWLARVGLSERAHHKPSELSGGERQRVAIARAVVATPACLLADEPTGNLDSENAAHVFDVLLALQRETGMSLVVMTHDDRISARLNRTIHIKDGKLLSASS